MNEERRSISRRGFMAGAGGLIGALGAAQLIAIRPVAATPASLAAAIRHVVGEA
jgi:hypothetical protein